MFSLIEFISVIHLPFGLCVYW